MAVSANSTVLPFPNKRKAPYPNPRYLADADFPPNVSRLVPPPVWIEVSAALAEVLRRGGHI